MSRGVLLLCGGILTAVIAVCAGEYMESSFAERLQASFAQGNVPSDSLEAVISRFSTLANMAKFILIVGLLTALLGVVLIVRDRRRAAICESAETLA
jgi:hypothetical protein